MSNTYTNFLDIEVVDNRDGVYVCEVALPEELNSWYPPSLEGAVRAILKLSKRNFQSMEESGKLQFKEGGNDLVKARYTCLYS